MENSADFSDSLLSTIKKPHTVRVRKRVVLNTETDTSKRLRTVRLMKNVLVDPLLVGPAQGSVEEDFLPEREEDPKAFLRVPTAGSPEALGPRYEEGKLIPYSVIGPADMFARQHTAELKSREDKAAIGNRRGTFILRKNKPPVETPEQRLQAKLQRIDEGRRKDIASKAQWLQSLPPGVRLLEAKQHKYLDEFEKIKRDWVTVGSGLAARVGRPPDLLVGEQYQLFREKQEEMELLSLSSRDQGPAAWYMSLRGGTKTRPTPRNANIPVGNMFSGIYAHMLERTKSAEVLIRRGKDLTLTTEETGSRTARKTFRDYPYFQQKVKEGRPSMTPRDMGSFSVQGVSKFTSELQALQMVGLEAFHPELLKTEQTEELVAQHYEAKYRY